MKIFIPGFLLASMLVITPALSFMHHGDGQVDWVTVKSKRYTFEIPGFMYEMGDLNQEAAHAYGYVTKQGEGEAALEMYCIVLVETHKEIKSYGLDTKFDAMSYSELAVQNLQSGLDAFQVITTNPKIEQINEMDCVRNLMKGKLGEVEVFYHLGVFHGKSAFYQVLTWTLFDQRNEFSQPMDRIIRSFDEK